jgi:hypothetical protein
MTLTAGTSKTVLGDAGEYYALSRFSFAGKDAAKMPDKWKAYDLAVVEDGRLLRMSVKTRSETTGWKKSRWFSFDDRLECDWIVLIFKDRNASVRAWVLPWRTALENANVPGPDRKDAWYRDISWSKLNKAPLSNYEDNWRLLAAPVKPPAKAA